MTQVTKSAPERQEGQGGMNTVPKKSFCVRCGRALKNPKSVERGMGPSCAKKFAIEQYKNAVQIEISMPPKRREGRKEEKVIRVCGYIGKVEGLMEYLKGHAEVIESLIKDYQKKTA